MTPKLVVPRSVAQRDLEAIDDYLFRQGGWAAKEAFLRAFDDAVGRIAAFPQSGSPQHEFVLGVDGLRTWRVRGFHYLVLYIDRDEFVDLWRVLDGRRDLGLLLNDPGAR